jgi:hypothetical protein
MFATPAWAGSDLVKAAKKEKQRREALEKKKAKQKDKQDKSSVLSNTTLPSGQGTLSVMGGSAPGSPASPKSSTVEPVKPSESSAPAEQKKGEQYWRGRVADAKKAVDAANKRVQELESRIPRLRSESIYIDDPAQRQQKGVELDQAIADLGKAKKQVDEAEQELDAVRAEGRRAGAYPAWLR